MSTTASHYFRFSRDFDGNGRRRCADCRLSYDDGDHIEITTLKPYTNYVCPSAGGLGHKSVYTGAYHPDGRTLRDHLCTCGANLVEEDRELWQLSFEVQRPDGDGHWTPVTTTKSKHAAQLQHAGLLELIDQGEAIRNVELVRLVAQR